MSKTAIIIGATGLTGSLLLQKLIADDNYTHIKLFLRRSTGIKHAKITEYMVDMLKLSEHQADFTGDAVFCCIGTTKAKTRSPEDYEAIDFGIPVAAAQLAKDNNITFFAVVSALGANASSRFFYNRVKGRMEQSVLSQGIPQTVILRPSLITGTRQEKRWVEDWGNIFVRLLNPLMLGKLKKYRSIKAESIAETLYKLPDMQIEQQIILSDAIQQIAEK